LPVITHPHLNDHGQKVFIRTPTTPTPLSTWPDPQAVATVVPGGPLPAELNGVRFDPWGDHPTTATEWNDYAGLKLDLAEPVMTVLPGKKTSAGVVVIERDGRVWAVHPTNGFGGYLCTFAKGSVEPGMSLQATAVREAWEESGLKVRIVSLLGDFLRTTSVTRYYLAERIGGDPSSGMGWESQACTLAPIATLQDLLNGAADKSIIAALQAVLLGQ
jgi:ADP-ribose pyrophosphatase YjhB (NUDIX family)